MWRKSPAQTKLKYKLTKFDKLSRNEFMNINLVQIPDNTNSADRHSAVLDAAFAVFLRYGFQRTTMDDIAKECGVSRPALYLLFKNKTDIFQALASAMFEKINTGAKRALEGDGSLEQRLYMCLRRGILDMTEDLIASPHGAELMDMKHAISADVYGSWRRNMHGLVSKALEDESCNQNNVPTLKGLTASELANILLDGLDGLKSRAQSRAERDAAALALVKLISGAVTR
jgi:AcrR family transcriptional regulator